MYNTSDCTAGAGMHGRTWIDWLEQRGCGKEGVTDRARVQCFLVKSVLNGSISMGQYLGTSVLSASIPRTARQGRGCMVALIGWNTKVVVRRAWQTSAIMRPHRIP